MTDEGDQPGDISSMMESLWGLRDEYSGDQSPEGTRTSSEDGELSQPAASEPPGVLAEQIAVVRAELESLEALFARELARLSQTLDRLEAGATTTGRLEAVRPDPRPDDAPDVPRPA